MRFQFLPLRFEFVARESLHFPPGKAPNILRGALGIVFRQLACNPECRDTRVCEKRASCPYARVFEPVSKDTGPSGLSDWPRPFIFRARHLDGLTLQPGDSFHFDVHLFSLDPDVLEYFVNTFAALTREGLGPRRGKAELQRVRRFSANRFPEQLVYHHSMPETVTPTEPVSLDLQPAPSTPGRIRVEFLSPTELKGKNEIAGRPEFPILFGRIRDRLSTLRTLYGPGPLDIDFRGLGERAAAIQMTYCDVHRQEAGRRSTRTGQAHSLGGLVGVAEYAGELGEFLPYLEAGRWVGVGRQVVWGKGEIALSIVG